MREGDGDERRRISLDDCRGRVIGQKAVGAIPDPPDPQAKLHKTKIEAGELGHIYFARAQYLRRRGIPALEPFRRRAAQSGDGALVDISMHIPDLTMWLMGSPKPVFGSTFDYLGRRDDIYNSWGPHNNAEFAVDDSAFACIKFNDGAVVSFEGSWAVNFEAYAQQQVTLAGDQGGDQVFPQKLFAADGKMFCDIEPGPIEDLDYREQHRLGIERFVDAFLNDRPALVDPKRARAVTQIIDAFYEPTESGGLAQIGPQPELRAGAAVGDRSGWIGCSHLAPQGSFGLRWIVGVLAGADTAGRRSKSGAGDRRRACGGGGRGCDAILRAVQPET